MLPIAAVLGVALVLHSARRKQPFIDVRMLARNRPLTVTYLRAGAVLMIVYCILYGFAQWLESGAGFSTSQAGLITMPMSLLAAVSSVTGGRTKGIRGPFIVSIGAALAGCICLFFIDSSKSAWIIAAAVVCFGVPQGMFSTATQTAVYLQAPADEIGTAAGLQRTAGYLGAIAATSLLGALYGKNCERSRPAQLGHRYGCVERLPVCRHDIRSHDSANRHGMNGSGRSAYGCIRCLHFLACGHVALLARMALYRNLFRLDHWLHLLSRPLRPAASRAPHECRTTA
ncbi:MFS transporter [Paraburkholderia sediminicola]|uniref:MFS transporter n=1 Tax=Paraburkholderia sediminicola TaxID=458836 RepID=UPI0038BB4338